MHCFDTSNAHSPFYMIIAGHAPLDTMPLTYQPSASASQADQETQETQDQEGKIG